MNPKNRKPMLNTANVLSLIAIVISLGVIFGGWHI